MWRLGMILFSYLLLAGCSAVQNTPTAIQPLPATPEQYFSVQKPIPSPSDFYRLTESQQQQFLAFYHAQAQQKLLPNQRLQRYLEQHLVNFNYQGKNLLASDTFHQMSGNCVSLALLTSALARLVDIDVRYRASYAEPMLDFAKNVLLSSAHVRSYLYAPAKNTKALAGLNQRDAIAIDYFPGRLDRLGAVLESEHFEAMIYNNLAVDAVLAGDLDQAFWLSRAALSRDSSYAPSMNLIAILYRRKGDVLASQQWYEFGLRYAGDPVTLLSNYLILAENIGDQPLLARLQQKLRRVDDDNPYVWFYLAYQAEQSQQRDDAVYYYKKLLEKAPYMHKASLALARLQLSAGDTAAAQKSLLLALQYSYEPPNRELYQAKLSALNNMKHQQH